MERYHQFEITSLALLTLDPTYILMPYPRVFPYHRFQLFDVVGRLQREGESFNARTSVRAQRTQAGVRFDACLLLWNAGRNKEVMLM